MSSPTSSEPDGRIALSVESVGKRYRLGAQAQAHALLAERLNDLPVLRRRASHADRPQAEEEWLWAVRGVSFDVRFGETLGIVGRNGAGKSTLLRLLASVTTPSEGRIVTYGKITALLGVGTGFHPQLTGRENVYLNASLMGMDRRRTQERFDEIVEFSGIERFLDTPVKRYSSGMYMRLAFSVAAHLDPEIMLVDEVLSVGDAEFKRKSLEKLREVVAGGRTVVFVSHSLGQVEALCDRVLLLERGNVTASGNPEAVVTEYIDHLELERTDKIEEGTDRRIPEAAHEGGDGRARLLRVHVTGIDDDPLEAVATGTPLRAHLTFDVREPIDDMVFEVGLSPGESDRFGTTRSSDGSRRPDALGRGIHEVAVNLHVHLEPGHYKLGVNALSAATGKPIDLVPNALRFGVLNHHGVAAVSPRGQVRVPGDWERPAAVMDPSS